MVLGEDEVLVPEVVGHPAQPVPPERAKGRPFVVESEVDGRIGVDVDAEAERA
ncbi:hypothetical protein [Amycolatopsis solani]|uniref:hypothetical protein n=1 Tax=Amycolatopsis solani TaxID=3028615 RepID=UPI0025B25458|nr:hypothetical protein [Amycolatopsis sp. MEP2-6]